MDTSFAIEPSLGPKAALVRLLVMGDPSLAESERRCERKSSETCEHAHSLFSSRFLRPYTQKSLSDGLLGCVQKLHDFKDDYRHIGDRNPNAERLNGKVRPSTNEKSHDLFGLVTLPAVRNS